MNLNRFPDGVTKKGFWSKALPTNAPDWMTRFHYEDRESGDRSGTP